ncbi:MAG: hypothetical protein BJ554DRAFT_3262, partial [Olpidium bornovanus]
LPTCATSSVWNAITASRLLRTRSGPERNTSTTSLRSLLAAYPPPLPWAKKSPRASLALGLRRLSFKGIWLLRKEELGVVSEKFVKKALEFTATKSQIKLFT